MFTLERPSTNGHGGGHVETIIVPPSRRRLPWRRIVAALVVVAIIVTGALVYRARTAGAATFVTTPVAQQNLIQTVSATGTVNPQNTINVGTQVSGTISEIDADYNSQVHAGQVLMKLDPTAMQAALDSAKSALAQSQAQAAAAQDSAAGSSVGVETATANANAAVASARAAQATAMSTQQAIAAAQSNVTKAQSALGVAQLTVSRDKSLLSQGYIPQAQADSDNANLVAAQTALQSAQVAVQQAQSQAVASQAQAVASQAQAASQDETIAAARETAAGSSNTADASADAIGIQEAAVQQAETNLQHTVITSPVNGTVIARDVSVGETVAASLQTPTLFSIAQDLSKMEVDLAVGEPDIGSVRAGENVNFTVLAYPSRTFQGTVAQVRKNPTTTNNVVTYTAVVLVNNGDGALLPGMTANATINVQTAQNALVVPLAALSFTPAHAAGGTHQGSAQHGGSPWGQTIGSASSAIAAGAQSKVFVQRNGKLTRVPVTVTLVSGTQAAVTPTAPATLAVGEAVIIAQTGGSTARPSRPAGQSGNPLTGGGAGGGALRGIH